MTPLSSLCECKIEAYWAATLYGWQGDHKHMVSVHWGASHGILLPLIFPKTCNTAWVESIILYTLDVLNTLDDLAKVIQLVVGDS